MKTYRPETGRHVFVNLKNRHQYLNILHLLVVTSERQAVSPAGVSQHCEKIINTFPSAEFRIMQGWDGGHTSFRETDRKRSHLLNLYWQRPWKLTPRPHLFYKDWHTGHTSFMQTDTTPSFLSIDTEATPPSCKLTSLEQHRTFSDWHRGHSSFTSTDTEATPLLLWETRRPHLFYFDWHRGHTSFTKWHHASFTLPDTQATATLWKLTCFEPHHIYLDWQRPRLLL